MRMRLCGVGILALAGGMALAVTVLQSCPGVQYGTPGGNGGNQTFSSFRQQIAPIFTNNCTFSGCHNAGRAEAGLVLEADVAFQNLVNRASTELPTMNRVTPNDVPNSYVVHKLEGTQAQVGGSGVRMPLGRAALSDAQIQLIKDWINAGAPDN